jgi:hypothetical protein
MTVKAAEEHEASAGGVPVHVRWVMPAAFFEIPLEVESPDATADQLLELASRVFPGGGLELQVEWAAMVAAQYDNFLNAGVQYAGFLVTEVEGQRCSATVHIALAELDTSDGADPVGSLAASLRALEVGDVSIANVPCGRAVCCIGTRQSTVDGALTDSGKDEPLWTSFIQVQVPLPNSTVVMLEMSTPTMAGWEVFSQMFAGIVKSVRLFDADGTPLPTSSAA